MLKPFSLIFFIAVMVWMGGIFVSTDPQVRMDRTCAPVEYMDKAGSGAMQLIDPGWGHATHIFFENMQYGCRFVVWRVFYEEDWKRAQQQQQGRSQAAVRGAEGGGAEKSEQKKKTMTSQ